MPSLESIVDRQLRGNLIGITCLSIDMEPAITQIISVIIWWESRVFRRTITKTRPIHSKIKEFHTSIIFVREQGRKDPEKSRKIGKKMPLTRIERVILS